MSRRTDSLAVVAFVERQPGRAASHGLIGHEFARRNYSLRRFAAALSQAIEEDRLVSDGRGGLEVRR